MRFEGDIKVNSSSDGDEGNFSVSNSFGHLFRLVINLNKLTSIMI